MAGYTCHEAVLVNRLSLAECNRKSNYSGLKTGGLFFCQEKQVGKQILPTSTLVVQNSHCPEFSHLANAP